ncbi:hypothetical protein, partial [Streptomyces sp. NPDC058206]|uniref:hypothetical protein n=1 Tax=Streptomyces sp. NPDC058206 TaxID=3346382 RepID=UPI0036E12823
HASVFVVYEYAADDDVDRYAADDDLDRYAADDDVDGHAADDHHDRHAADHHRHPGQQPVMEQAPCGHFAGVLRP